MGGVVVLLKQLASCYESISWKRFKELTFSDDQLTDIELERIIAFSVYYGDVCCRISHANKLITFNDNSLESTMFCNSIVELNALLIRIKDEYNSKAVDDSSRSAQRQNVFNLIRTQMPAEHAKTQNRLRRARQTRTNQIKNKRQEEKKKADKIKQEEQIKKVKEQKEKEKVKESRKT